jgi:RNA polymerase sigma factor (sigma-70 family)
LEELVTLVARVQAGDCDAYEAIVRRFQDMAVGYACSVLGDFQLAEDAAQEAFVCAYYDLPALRDPAAFPGWFRQIVFKQIDRLRRGRRVLNIPLELAAEMAVSNPGPAEMAERHEMQDKILQAIEALPEHQRSVVTLFYIGEYSQKEISAFLEIPVATVKTRLHAARKQLKERMMAVLQDTLHQQRPSRDDQFTQKVMSLFKATIEGDVAQVKTMLAQDPALARTSGPIRSAIWRQESPALQVAVMYGRKDIVDLLLAHGADINEVDGKSGFTALLNAIDLAGFLPDYAALGMVDLLIARGAKKDIFCYLWLGDDEGLKAFLQENPDSVNAIGPSHATPLCFAHTIERAQLLLDRGADMFARIENDQGLTTPIRFATRLGAMSGNWQVFSFLLDRAGVKSDIFLACVLGEMEQVKTALELNPAFVQVRTSERHVLTPGLTALHLAAEFGHVEIARLLIERGADVNARAHTIKDMTPLHLAIWLGRRKLDHKPMPELLQESGVYHLLPDVPRLLLEHGADVNARDSEGHLTPLGWAETELEDETDRSEVTALLKKFGAQT